MQPLTPSRRASFLIAMGLFVMLLFVSTAVAHAEEGAVRGGSCTIYYNTTTGSNHAFCGSFLYPCQTKAYAAQRAASCPAPAPGVTPTPPDAPAPAVTPDPVLPPTTPDPVLPPVPPDPNMPAPDWLEVIFPGFDLLADPTLYDTPLASFSLYRTIRPDTFSANFVDPALLIPSEAIELDPVRNAGP